MERLITDAHPLSALARRWSKHCDLSEADRSAVLRLPFVRKRLGKDAYLVREGDHTTECSLLVRGFAFRQKLLRDGGRQIISIHIATEFVDLQNGLLGVADHNVQSVDGCETASITRAALIELADARPTVRLATWIDTLIDASIFANGLSTSGAAIPARGSPICYASSRSG